MTILEILEKAAAEPVAALLALLAQVKAKSPDLAPAVDNLTALLNTAVSAENLVALATALPAEIAAIAGGKLDPKEHPSDLA